MPPKAGGAELWPAIFPGNGLPDEFPDDMSHPITTPTNDHDRPGDMQVARARLEGSDDEDDEDYGKAPRRKARKAAPKPATKKKRGRRAASEDSDDDEEGHRSRSSRVVGGRAPVPKKVCVDLDSDDELIKVMKDAGFRDEAVRERLIKEGRTRYDAKTISTRYRRIIACLAEHEEKVLDEEFSDYREGEDELLDAAQKLYIDEYEKDLKAIEDKFWTGVASHMKKSMPRPKYTKAICRARYESIAEGTARPPVELDDNPEAREAEIVAKREERARLKAAEEAEEVRKALELEQKKEAKQSEAAAKIRKRRDARADKEAEQKKFQQYVEQMRHEKQKRQRAIEAARSQRGLDQQTNDPRADRERRQEQLIGAKLTNNTVAATDANGQETPDEARIRNRLSSNLQVNMATRAAANTLGENHSSSPANYPTSSPAYYNGMANTYGSSSNVNYSGVSDDDEIKDESMLGGAFPAGSPSATFDQSFDTPIPTHPEADPRYVLTHANMVTLLRHRNVSFQGNHLDLLARIMEYDNTLSHVDLSGILRRRGITTWGTRGTLLKRLADSDVAGCTGQNLARPAVGAGGDGRAHYAIGLAAGTDQNGEYLAVEHGNVSNE